jgi:hypothetical protein
MGFIMLALVSSGAPAQIVSPAAAPAVQAAIAEPAATPQPAATAQPTTAPNLLQRAVATITGVIQARPASSVSLSLAPAIAKEAAWLYRAGWPLYALIDRYSAGAPLDEQANCVATAVYFEARGESPEGQLAVARVVMNRAASGKYPPSWCATVKQPWQFSFVRNGRFPAVDEASDSWRKAQAITRLAISNAVPSLSNDVLWYHANYVAPSWRLNLKKVEKIGTHIFYRA